MRTRPELQGKRQDDLFSELAPFYDLGDEVAFDDMLAEIYEISLFEVATSEDDERPSAKAQGAHRAQAYAAARCCAAEANTILEALKRIEEAQQRFEQAMTGWPVLRTDPFWKALFDITDEELSARELPSAIAIVRTFSDLVVVGQAKQVVQELASMPLKKALDRGRVRANPALYEALEQVRGYWTEAEMKSWSMFRLKEIEVRDANDIADLSGACESFVADLLVYFDLIPSLQALSTAWQAIDADRRKAQKNTGTAS